MVAIIGISAAIAAPAMMESMAVRRSSEASHTLVRIGARARTEAVAYGRAYVLRFAETSGGGGSYGSVELWRGRVDRCSANPWSTIISGTCASARDDCLESLDMGRYAYPTYKVQMRMTGATAGSLCFQPNGDMFFTTNVTAAPTVWRTTPPSGTGGIRFTLDRLNGATVTGVQRVVVFPFGAGPRLLR